MGWFDKVKTAFGGHGVKVEAVSVERQPVDGDIVFPLTDSVIKGQFKITFSSSQEVLSHVTEFVLQRRHPDGRDEPIVLGVDRHDAAHPVYGAQVAPPYTARPGQVVESGFCITDVDIPNTLMKLGYLTPGLALADDDLSFYVRVTADVKGTILDADVKVPIEIAA